MTNLLDIISPTNTGSSNLIRYKPLHHSKIDSISMAVCDINGTAIHFDDRDYTVFELKIRPVSL